MVDIPDRGLLPSKGVDDHLWEHGLSYFDAEEVWAGPAKYFRQDARTVFDEFKQPFRQPARLIMIGPDFAGRLLTFVLTIPNTEERSYVVTGWGANRDEQTRYHRPGGRMRSR
ncbi:MAG: hypothetical protein F4007_10130 [Chloroflexi bacterium]|nr:hypothetical protein [Chloroflexota bacterium]